MFQSKMLKAMIVAVLALGILVMGAPAGMAALPGTDVPPVVIGPGVPVLPAPDPGLITTNGFWDGLAKVILVAAALYQACVSGGLCG